MTTTLAPLEIRRRLDRRVWGVPQPFGPDGWKYRTHISIPGTDAPDREIIVTACDWEGVEWIHASIARPDRMPDYDDLVELHRGVFGDAWAYQLFAPPESHVNIHPFALHLWGRHDGEPVMPDFGGVLGSI